MCSDMADPVDIWFEREILVHEEALVRYLHRTWPRREEVDDLRQDIYVRVYEAGMRARPVATKSFLFTTARNLMADRIRRGRIVSIDATGDLEILNALMDEVSPEQRISARQELQRLAQAFDQLPPRCREVMWTRRVEGLSIRAAAERFGVSEGTIEKQLARATELLTSYFFGGNLGSAGRSKHPQRDVGHGEVGRERQ